MVDGLMVDGLTVDDVSVRFEDTLAVDRVSLAVPRGSVLAVLGPSGCGKSTLLRTIAGLERPAAGTVRFDGEDLAGVPTHRRDFAMVFQDGQLFAHLDVAGNVGYPLRLRRVAPARRRERVEELLDLVGLPGYAGRSTTTLSGGERQRVALARSLAVEPRLLLLDEPLSALDRGLRERLAADLHDILRRAGATAVLVTHDQEEAWAVADRMAVMREGRIVQQGALDEVWAHPADAWAAAFLGYATVLTGDQAHRLLDLTGRPGRPARPARAVALALRRSALRVVPDGQLEARVQEARVTPEQVRVLLDVAGVGVVPGVAAHGTDVRLGAQVRVALDHGRVAEVPVNPVADEH